MLFMMFIIRAGIQILAGHPRLYWKRDCTPGKDWFRFQKAVPTGRVWTSKDDSVTLPGWLGIPGIRHSIGLARWWHFSVNLLWVLNGVAFYALLFTTGQWLRLVPVTWSVFPNALSTAIQYASLDFPMDHGWTRFNGLQRVPVLDEARKPARIIYARDALQCLLSGVESDESLLRDYVMDVGYQ